jgi:hypothetical protein
MSFLKRLFGGKPEPERPRFTHLVQVCIPLASGPFGDESERERVLEIEGDLRDALAKQPIGEVDGHDFGAGTFLIWLYGRSASELAEFVRANLPEVPPGTTMLLRHGDVEDRNAREETIAI